MTLPAAAAAPSTLIAQGLCWPRQGAEAGVAGRRFEALDGLRGVAAVCVVFRHVALGGARHPLPLSYLAVDFFFCLSGFVLAASYTALAERRVSLRDHLVKRAIRLWPTYLLGLALSVGFLLTRDAGAVARALPGALLLLPLLRGEDGAVFPLMGPAWSLFGEFWIANLLFALLHRFGRPSARTPLWIALAALPAFAAAVWIKGSGDFGGFWRGLPFVGGRVLVGFGLGVWLRGWAPRLGVGLPPWSVLPLAGLMLGLFALPVSGPASLLLAVLAMPALVLAGSCVRSGGWSGAAAEAAGAMSYPLYVLQVGLGMAAVNLAAVIPLLRGPHATLVAAAAMLAVSYAVALLFDRPVRLWMERRWLTRAPSAGVLEAASPDAAGAGHDRR